MRFWHRLTEKQEHHSPSSLHTEYKKQEAINNCSVGSRLLQEGLEDEALAEFQKALRNDRACAEAHYNLGVIYSRLKQVRRAIRHYEQAVLLDPSLFQAHNDLGLVYASLGRIVDAIKAFIQAVRVNSDYYEAHNNLGLLYYDRGRYPEAIKACNKALQIKPDYPNGYYVLGLIYIDLRSAEDALAAYRVLRGLDKTMADELFKAIHTEFRSAALSNP